MSKGETLLWFGSFLIGKGGKISKLNLILIEIIPNTSSLLYVTFKFIQLFTMLNISVHSS